MARDANLSARIKLEGGDRVEQQLGDIADAAEKVEEPVELRVDANLTRALDQLDQLNEQARADAVAMEQLGQAMGPELAGRADLGRVLAQLKEMGMTAEDVTANAEELGQKLQQVDSPDLGGKLGQALGTTRGQMEELTDSARGANSALANMVGNSAQDIANVGGVAGSAGVAIGQMAEYFSDAALAGEGLGSSLGSMLAVAGPIAALAAGTALLSAILGEVGKGSKEAAERTSQLSDALQEGGDASLAFAKVLRDNGKELQDFIANANDPLGGFGVAVDDIASKVPLIGGLFKEAGVNIFEAMSKAGLSVYDMSEAMAKGGTAADEFRVQLAASKEAGLISGKEFNAVSEVLDKYTDSAGQAAKNAGLFKMSGDEVAATLRQIGTEADPLSEMPATWETLFSLMRSGKADTSEAADAVNQLAEGLGMSQEEVLKFAQGHLDEQMKDAADATDQAREAAEEYAKVLSSADWGTSTVNAAAEGWQKLAESQFGVQNIAAGTQAAYDDLNKSIKDNGFTFDIATEKGRANAEQIQTLYSSLIPQLSAAFADAGGDVNAFAGNMDALRTQVFEQLDQQTGLTKDQINAVIDQLGVFDGSTYSSTFEMLGVQDANTKLALLSGVLSSLPPDVQRQVTLDIIAGDPQAALTHIEQSVSGGATVPLTADPSAAQTAANALVGGIEGTVATVPVAADTKEATKEAQGVKTTAEALAPIVKVDANTQAAIMTIVLLAALAAKLQPIVTVKADASQAFTTLALLEAQRPQVPVTAFLRDYPSNADITNRIGVIRVPVDAYLRSEPRISGTI